MSRVTAEAHYEPLRLSGRSEFLGIRIPWQNELRGSGGEPDPCRHQRQIRSTTRMTMNACVACFERRDRSGYFACSAQADQSFRPEELSWDPFFSAGGISATFLPGFPESRASAPESPTLMAARMRCHRAASSSSATTTSFALRVIISEAFTDAILVFSMLWGSVQGV